MKIKKKNYTKFTEGNKNEYVVSYNLFLSKLEPFFVYYDDLTFKNFMHQHFQIKMQECLLFQKLSSEEKVLLSAIEYLNKK